METKRFLPRIGVPILVILITSFFSNIKANLDTTTGPDLDKALVISNTYTFTDFELARGTVRFKNGFNVPNSATIDVHEPVSGTITVVGNLYLAGDLYLAPGVKFNAPFGAIHLNGHTIFLQDHLDLASTGFNLTLTCSPNGVLDGQGHKIILSNSVSSVSLVNAGPDTTFRNLRFEGCIGNNIFNAGVITTRLDNCSFLLIPGNQFTLASPVIHCYRNVAFDATENTTMNMSVGPTGQLYIHSGATLYAGPGMEYGLSSNTNPIFDDHSATMHLNGAIFNWFSSRHENALINGTVIIEGNAQFWRQGTTGLPRSIKIGDGNINDDLNLFILPGSSLKIGDPGHPTTLIYANVG